MYLLKALVTNFELMYHADQKWIFGCLDNFSGLCFGQSKVHTLGLSLVAKRGIIQFESQTIGFSEDTLLQKKLKHSEFHRCLAALEKCPLQNLRRKQCCRILAKNRLLFIENPCVDSDYDIKNNATQ